MTSLTSFLPILVPHLGMTQAAIYERQRALVRLGLLPQPTGRGRGSGAKATPETAALIFLSVLATDSLSEMDERIANLASAKIWTWRKRKTCGLTRATTFIDAISAILADPALASRVQSIHVERQAQEGGIHWAHARSKNLDVSNFVTAPSRVITPSSIRVSARLDGGALRQAAAVLAAQGAKP